MSQINCILIVTEDTVRVQARRLALLKPCFGHQTFIR